MEEGWRERERETRQKKKTGTMRKRKTREAGRMKRVNENRRKE